jgi:hypothetical protein
MMQQDNAKLLEELTKLITEQGRKLYVNREAR